MLRLQCGLLFGISLACTSGICQWGQRSQWPGPEFNPTINAPPERQLTQQTPAGEAVRPEDRIQLSLQQAVRMALEKNLDIQLEQLDQSVADFSVTLNDGRWHTPSDQFQHRGNSCR